MSARPDGADAGAQGGAPSPTQEVHIPTPNLSFTPSPTGSFQDFSGLPRSLRDVVQFLPWRAVSKPGGFRKVPLGNVAGEWRPVNSADPACQLSLNAAVQVVRDGQASGVGVHLSPALRLVGLDLDRCLAADGTLDDIAADVLATFPGTYAERSPSGQGLHVLIPGTCPTGWRRRPGIDVITAGFLTVTGDVIRNETASGDRSAGLAAWHARWVLPGQGLPVGRAARPDPAWSERTAALFAELGRGGLAHYATASEADLAFVLLLLRRDPDLTDGSLFALVQASRRMRPKWTGASYRAATFHTARQIRARSHP